MFFSLRIETFQILLLEQKKLQNYEKSKFLIY